MTTHPTAASVAAHRAATDDTAYARVSDAVKVHGAGETEVRALDGVSVGFPTGRFTAIMGPSGSGASTLTHCAAGLSTLTSGSAFVADTELGALDDRRLTLLRRQRESESESEPGPGSAGATRR
ncbi:hypothetical protein GCM10023324_59220 [Streptomyces youssoufiensis]